ncbi:hypothetical protein, partial [Novacetimonas hansenii]|uniref:hypothetical protein n=1 Tax=Novacetimonas hansenii TaxID=436 RepID=UPI001A7E6CE9
PFFKKAASFEAFWKNLHKKPLGFQYVIEGDFPDSLSSLLPPNLFFLPCDRQYFYETARRGRSPDDQP